MTVLRFGVVGTGPWARAVHIPAARLSDRAELVGILGRDASRMARLVPDVAAYTELDEFLDAVDIVGFAVPPHTQGDLAEAAIAAGKHVLLEKPVSTSGEVALRLAQLAEDQGIHSVTLFPHLLDPVLSSWAEVMRERSGWWAGRVETFSSVLRDESNPFHASRWRHDRGGLWDMGPHAVAQMCAVLGHVAAVSAYKGAGDLVSVLLEHENGSQSSLALGAAFPAPAPVGSGTYFVGEQGRAVQPVVAEWTATALGAYRIAIARLADQMLNVAGPHASDIHFGAHVTCVLAAAERSMASGRAELVSPDLEGGK